MKKKILSLLICTSMLLCACGTKEPSVDDADKTITSGVEVGDKTDNTVNTPESTATPEPTATPIPVNLAYEGIINFIDTTLAVMAEEKVAESEVIPVGGTYDFDLNFGTEFMSMLGMPSIERITALGSYNFSSKKAKIDADIDINSTNLLKLLVTADTENAFVNLGKLMNDNTFVVPVQEYLSYSDEGELQLDTEEITKLVKDNLEVLKTAIKDDGITDNYTAIIDDIELIGTRHSIIINMGTVENVIQNINHTINGDTEATEVTEVDNLIVDYTVNDKNEFILDIYADERNAFVDRFSIVFKDNSFKLYNYTEGNTSVELLMETVPSNEDGTSGTLYIYNVSTNEDYEFDNVDGYYEDEDLENDTVVVLYDYVDNVLGLTFDDNNGLVISFSYNSVTKDITASISDSSSQMNILFSLHNSDDTIYIDLDIIMMNMEIVTAHLGIRNVGYSDFELPSVDSCLPYEELENTENMNMDELLRIQEFIESITPVQEYPDDLEVPVNEYYE